MSTPTERPLPDPADLERHLEQLQALRDALAELQARLEYTALELRLLAALERGPH